jgi:hypothetical protein
MSSDVLHEIVAQLHKFAEEGARSEPQLCKRRTYCSRRLYEQLMNWPLSKGEWQPSKASREAREANKAAEAAQPGSEEKGPAERAGPRTGISHAARNLHAE